MTRATLPETSIARTITSSTRAVTATVSVAAPAAELFHWISRLEHLPLWATEFCRDFRVEDGVGRAETPRGPATFEVDADEATGVVDVLVGDGRGSGTRYPGRVVGLPGNRSAFLFTVVRRPAASDEETAAEAVSLERELENVRARFDDEGDEGTETEGR